MAYPPAVSALPGADVSHHQGIIDWPTVAASGLAWVFVKRTEGTTFVDSRGAANSAGARATGLVQGDYHFLRSSNPRGQARHFLSTIGDPRGRLCALDVERSAGGDEPQIHHVREWADEFYRLTDGHPLVIYTGRWYWVGVMGNPYGADITPHLWHSEYESTVAEVNDGPESANYGGWARATFWQFTSSSLGGDVPGIPGNEDKNLFYGSHADLAALTGTTPGRDWFDMATQADLEAVVTANGMIVAKTIIEALNKPTQLIDFVKDPEDRGVWLVFATSLRYLFGKTLEEQISLGHFQAHWAARGYVTAVQEWSPHDLYVVPITNNIPTEVTVDVDPEVVEDVVEDVVREVFRDAGQKDEPEPEPEPVPAPDQPTG